MGSWSIWHWLIVLVVVVIVFGGKGRVSNILADIGKGLRGLKNNLDEKAENTTKYKAKPKAKPAEKSKKIKK